MIVALARYPPYLSDRGFGICRDLNRFLDGGVRVMIV